MKDQQKQLIDILSVEGIYDKAVLRAIEQVPREEFVLEEYQYLAYDNNALPIIEGQTISQPYIVALMTMTIHLPFVKKVLEVGTGCGYQTAVLSHIFSEIYSIERIKRLHIQAKQRLSKLNINNITLLHGDGFLGYEAQAPFDAIIVTAASQDIPDALLAQLNDPGVMVIPIGAPDHQILYKVLKRAGRIEKVAVEHVRFVPLLPGTA